MDPLAKSLGKALTRFQSLPLSRRLAVGGVLALIVLSVAFIFKSGSGTSEREYLSGGREFSREDITAIETAFGNAKLGDWKVVGYRIEIPTARKAEYLAALSTDGLLLGGINGTAEESGFFTSDSERERLAKIAKQQKMSRVVGRMPGIQEVGVEYSESRSSGFPRTIEKRAAVAVKADGGRHLDHQEVAAIQTVIAAAEAGLPVENVVVLDINAKRTYEGSSDGSDAPARSVIDGQKKLYEDRIQQQIRSRLVNYPGLVVEVSVQPTATKDQVDNVSDGLTLQGIAVSIGVPTSYYERLWKKRFPSFAESDGHRPSRLDLAEIESETLRKIEEIVEGLLNEVDLPDDRRPNIVVRTDEDFASTDQVVQADTGRIWSLLSERGQPLLLALGALVVVVAWLVFSRNKKRPSSESETVNDSGLPLITARKAADESDEDFVSSGIDSIKSDPSGDLKDQLSELVQKDPDAAVDALRKWIRKVA